MHKRNVCTGCGLCLQGCGHEVCKGFERCAYACPNGALSIAGERVSAAELAGRLAKNADFFSLTGGGITASGGEPLMQSEFVIALAEELDKFGSIHKALQTSGYADPEIYRRVIDKFDYIMQDIKLVNEEEHIKYTGVSNKRILQNIEYLKISGKEFLFRVPMIPGITDTEENLAAIRLLTEGCEVEYLKYNDLAGAKYEMLGMQYPLQER
jgi:pyruvate formate lyase activating enzyme